MSILGLPSGPLEALGGALLAAFFLGGLFVALVWVVSRLAPTMPPRVRCALWWLATAKLLVLLVWNHPVELALLPHRPAPPATGEVAAGPDEDPTTGLELLPAGSFAASLVSRGLEAAEAAETEASVPRASPPAAGPGRGFLGHLLSLGLIALAGLWLIAVVGSFAQLRRELRTARRLVRGSTRIDAGPVVDLAGSIAARLGLARVPDLRLSAAVRSPQVVGAWRPSVLLPPAALVRGNLGDRHRLAIVLCHELAHVRRRDLLFGWIPVLAERLFFFHPLARLAAREYSLAREGACDALVVRVLDATPREVGRQVLTWGVTPHENGLAAASTSPSFALLKRRLEMLGHLPAASSHGRPVWWAAVALALLGLVPFTIVAQAPPVPVFGVSEDTSTGYVYLDDDEALVANARVADVEALRDLRETSEEPILLVRLDGWAWVVRDPALMARVDRMLDLRRSHDQRKATALRGRSDVRRRLAELDRTMAGIDAQMVDLRDEEQRERLEEQRELSEREQEGVQVVEQSLDVAVEELQEEETETNAEVMGGLRELVEGAAESGMAVRLD